MIFIYDNFKSSHLVENRIHAIIKNNDSMDPVWFL